MDGQDHKITATSATVGHEGHGVHLCHICGWPFPNPHPSAKHRRAHKRVCGTLEGYKIIHSEDQDHHLAVSDDDNASDDDEHHTPNPNIVKKTAGSSGREGEKSARSEDDVFSDAVTDFSDSGISPRLEEQFESVKESYKISEQKSMEGDLHGSGMLEVEEASDRIEQSIDTRSEEISKHEPLVNGNNQPDNGVLIMDSIELTDDSQPKHGVQNQEHGSASVPLVPEESKSLDLTIAAEGSQDALHDKLESEVAKHHPPPPSESLQTSDASEGIDTLVHSAEISTSTKIVEIAIADETSESVDAFVGTKEVSHSTENIGSVESVVENASPEESQVSLSSVESNEGTKIMVINEHSEMACKFYSIDNEETPIASLEGGQPANNFDTNEEEKLSSVNTNSGLSSTHTALANEDDISTMAKKDENHCGENINSTALETGNVKDGVSFVEADVIPHSMMSSEKMTEFSSSCVADVDAKGLQELLENGDGFEKSIRGHGLDRVTEVLQTASAEAGSEADHDIGDVPDKNTMPTLSVEHTTLPITSELPNIIHVAKEAEVESLDVAVKNDCYIREDANASESIVTADNESIVVTREIPPAVKIDDLSTSKPELTFNRKALSDECFESSDAPNVKQPAPSPSDVQEFQGNSDAVGNTLINVEDIADVNAKSVIPEVDEKSTRQTEDASAIDVSGSLTSRSDSLEANCGSVISDTLETNSQKPKSQTEEICHDKSDTFEPPSFMTLIQSGNEGDQVTAATEIEAVQNNEQPKSDPLQECWFPSLTNVVIESEGRKKNEEMIAKVTNWSPVKQQHSPLKSLLNEVKSPSTKQVPAANQKIEDETKDDNVGVTTVKPVVASETHTTKDQGTNNHVEEWNSPARYPIEVKKEKKGRPFWVPFVCCSSTHRDL